ncbi:hypothetical protein [Rhizobium sp. NFR03]|uniref:hypothetical protein n=1 Tax=Rhizobium sp. NFR03 TaxID=1566263 RepID=UPI0008BCA8AF|nr:hypothetical protein [Rhizobium sp. NFR03]SES38266.1 hypothetical protein SAMN03159406_03876 [Rhizobium sp. NFR03]
MNPNAINEEANRFLAIRIGELVMAEAAGAAHTKAMLAEIERLQKLTEKPSEPSEGAE